MQRPGRRESSLRARQCKSLGRGGGGCRARGRGRSRNAAADGSEESGDETSDGGLRSPRTKCGRRVEKGKGDETARK